MLEITTEAKAELVRFTQQELTEGEFVRISRAYQCGGPKFQLTVDDERTPMDETVGVNGLEIVVERSCLELLQGTQLDFTEQGFSFFEDLGNQC